MKLLLKRILPGFALYGCGVQTYVLYNAFRGKPREFSDTSGAIDVQTLPEVVQATRAEMVQDVVDFYNLKVRWKHFDESYIHNEPLFSMKGIETVKKYHQFCDKYLLPPASCTGSLKSLTHYESSLVLNIDTTSATTIGNFELPMTILLDLANTGGSGEKIVNMQEEWNHVPLLSAENRTMFPLGWSAEILRKFLAKVLVALA